MYALLQAYPFLEQFLLLRVRGFERLSDVRARTRWARVMTLNDIAVQLNISWRQLARDVGAEVERVSGRAPRAADAPRRIVDDGRRLDELRGIVGAFERGQSLQEAAERWRIATADLEEAEMAALDAALSGGDAAGPDAWAAAVRQVSEASDASPALPQGHPLRLLRREADLIRALTTGLAAQLGLLGGSSARHLWRQEKPLVARLVDRLSALELRFRRQRQAWFPTLDALGVGEPQRLLTARQEDALEALRRLRLAVERDDAAAVAEAGMRLVAAVEELLAQDERLLESVALRHFSGDDWLAVRTIEDGVGWALIPSPPPWPGS